MSKKGRNFRYLVIPNENETKYVTLPFMQFLGMTFKHIHIYIYIYI